MTTAVAGSARNLGQQALDQLEKLAELRVHLAAYVLVNTVLLVVLVTVVDGGPFWPIFPLLGWGIGLALHAMDVYRLPVSEKRMAREVRRRVRRGQQRR